MAGCVSASDDKMMQNLCSDWLANQGRWAYLATLDLRDIFSAIKYILY